MFDYFIGIDPGKQGGLVAIRGDMTVYAFQPMPETIHGVINWLSLHAVGKTLATIEKAQAMPKNGAVSMFNYGMGFGEILGALAALKIPFQMATPVAWTKMMHVGQPTSLKPKQKSLRVIEQLYPGLNLKASDRCKKPHDGIVDAFLIAVYGLRQNRLN